MDSAGQDGVIRQKNMLEEDKGVFGGAFPAWWSWISWPDYWMGFNGAGQITWQVDLAPGKSQEFEYQWH